MSNIPERVYHKCEKCRVTFEVLTTSPDSPKVLLDAEGNLMIEELRCTGWHGHPRVSCDQVYSGKVHLSAKDAGCWTFDESGGVGHGDIDDNL